MRGRERKRSEGGVGEARAARWVTVEGSDNMASDGPPAV